ncbi:MAG: YitT family protein [Oscillospiraceae bacterium]|nr:YitT family protein [Oscillospiraceae bacterium]
MENNMSIRTRVVRIAAGLLFTAAAYVLFLNPHGISVGGMTGLCVLINRYLHIPNTIALAVLNLFLFVYGWRVKGNAFTLRSVAAMFLLGVLLDLPYPEITPLFGRGLSMMIGSCMSGVGYGLIVSAETSTGGADQLGLIVTAKCPRLSVGIVMNIFDAVVVAIDSIITGNWLFSAAAVLFCNTFIDITDCAANKKGLPGWAQSVIAFARHVSRLPMEIFEAIGAN